MDFSFLSSTQKNIWITQSRYPESNLYNVTGYATIYGKINTAVLRQAIEHRLTVTDALDPSRYGLNYQHKRSYNLQLLDNTTEISPDLQSLQWMEQNAKETVLPDERMMDIAILVVSPQKCYWYVKAHHLFFDGYAMSLFFNEVTSIYERLINNEAAGAEFGKYRYADFVNDEAAYAVSTEYSVSKNFWKKKLEHLTENKMLLSLMNDQQPENLVSKRKELKLPREEMNRITEFCKTLHCSPLHYFTACLALLNRLSGNAVSNIGLPVFNRSNHRYKNTLGTFINVIPFSIACDPDQSLSEFFITAKQELAECFRHQKFPLIDITEELNIRENLYNVLFSYQRNTYSRKLGDATCSIEYMHTRDQVEDLKIHLLEYSEQDDLLFLFDYRCSAFSEENIALFIKHFDRLIKQLYLAPQKKLKEIRLLAKDEISELAAKKSYTSVEETIVELFEERVTFEPETIALTTNDAAFSYAELNARANSFARLLKAKYKIMPNDLVALQLEKNEAMIVAMLAVLKSGGAYVPIDPSYPEERVKYIVEDSKCKALVNAELLEAFRKDEKKYSSANLRTNTGPDDLAYVIYTSGSTGQPKGVMVEHRNVVSFFNNLETVFSFRAGMAFGSVTNYTFDISVLELLGTLVCGIRLHLIPSSDPLEILTCLEEQKIEGLQLTPSRLNQLIEAKEGDMQELKKLKVLLVGGESLGLINYGRLKELKDTRTFNVYGPTETTIWSSCLEISGSRELSIGKPLPDEDIFILNDMDQLQPIGVTGEICIGGNGVTRGYLNNKKLTAEKFIKNPYDKKQRIYKTGDLGRLRPDGTIEFSGRKDDQVKIRGYRIEPGEVENVLKAHKKIKNAVVLIKEGRNGERDLAAYITGKKGYSLAAVKEFMKERLPEYMIPHYYAELEVMPLTVSGKIDRKALAGMDAGIFTGSEYIAPRNETEVLLAKIWSEVLNIEKEKISVKSNFFEAGGHSLKATRLIALVQKQLRIKLELKEIFAHPVLEQQAVLISSGKKIAAVYIKAAEDKKLYQLSSAQKRLFFLHEFAPESTSYNMPVVSYLGYTIDKAKIRNAFRELIKRHESLRTSFVKSDGMVFQQISDDVGFELDEHQCSLSEFETYIRSYVRPFSLGTAPLLRSCIVEIKDTGYAWIVDLHHIISDGTSHIVLADDFMRLYRGEDLLPLKLQYRDFSEWQNAEMESGALNTQKNFWLSRFADGIPKLNFPADRTRPAAFSFEGDTYKFNLGKELSKKITDFNAAQQGTLTMTMMSVLNVLLYKYTGQDDIVVGCGIAGRRHPDLERIVGMFINSLALRNFPSGNKTFGAFHKEVIESSLNGYENQDIQFEDLVDMMDLERDPSRNPVFDICLVVQNFDHAAADKLKSLNANNGTSAAIDLLSAIDYRSVTSKFDMTWFVNEVGDDISINLEYYSAIFNPERIERIAGHFRNILAAVLDNPSILLSQIDITAAAEKQTLLETFAHGIAMKYPEDKTLVELFEEQAARTPDATAIVSGNETITYRELNERANRLAGFLHEKLNVQAEARLGIFQSRSPEMIISVLATMKAGGAYVPLDIEYPETRLLYMLEDAGVEIVLTEKNCVDLANRLLWRSKTLKYLVCNDSKNIYAERGQLKNELMNKELWDHVGNTAENAIAGGGWMSSYTGEDFSEMEMKEYADNIYLKLKKILRKDMKVLEIGCSSGLTMFQIAPEVAHYHGTDLSSAILANTQTAATEKGCTNITLTCMPADEIGTLDADGFDLIIINSVIHCFDSHNYLRDVLLKCIGKLNDKGALFLGDLMDEDKREALIEDLTSFQQANRLKGYRTKTDWSSELFVSRDYFNDLAAEGFGIAAISYSEKIHTIENELTRYRYDALVIIDKHSSVKACSEKKKHQFDQRETTKASALPLNVSGGSNSLAYVIYTSGSTGKPKGVMVEHRSIVNYISWAYSAYAEKAPADIHFGLFTSLSFDLTVTSIYMPLLKGGMLRLFSPEMEMPDVLKEYFAPEGTENYIKLTPSHIRMVEEMQLENTAIVCAVVGGEELHAAHIRTLKRLNPGMAVYNEYGPTEATVGCIVWKADDAAAILIGKPIANTAVWILNESDQPVPVGVTGELCISGDGLARGYLNKPELTSEKFSAHPFIKGQRIYKTGDLGRWLPDGSIEFTGRRNDQVKIRGYRIELGEIENSMLLHPHLQEAVVLAVTDPAGDKNLVAYLVSREKLNVAELASFLGSRLPAYMIPSYFVQVDQLPLTTNGKLDRKKLPDPFSLSMESGEEYKAPSDETEEQLALIWQEILGKEKIGVRDNFFRLGGHSLKATRLISQIHKLFEVKLELKQVFEKQTLEEQAVLIRSAQKTIYASIPVADKEAGYYMSSAQRRLWVLSQFEDSSIAYNMHDAFIFEGALDVNALQSAFLLMIERHESLRTVFKENEKNEIRQYVLAPGEITFSILQEDLRPEIHPEKILSDLVQLDAIQPFGLAAGPLLRASLFQVADQKWIFSYAMHHIIADGWAMGILVKELLLLYNAALNKKQAALPPLRIHYKDYSTWQQGLLSGNDLQSQKQYWLKQFEGPLPLLELPSDRLRPPVKTYNGSIVKTVIPKEIVQSIKKITAQKDATLFMTMFAALNTLFYRYTNQEDIIIGSPVAGREHADLEDQIGLFLNMLPLRTRFNGSDSFSDLLENIKALTLNAYKNQAYPFDELVDQLHLKRDISRSALFDVMLILQNTDAGAVTLRMPDVKISPYTGKEQVVSKFDLTFDLTETGETIQLSIEYNSDIFERARIERMADHFMNILAAAAADPGKQLCKLNYLGEKEKAALLYDFNDTAVEYDEQKVITALFEEQVKKTPDAVALVFENREFSYKELNSIANRLGDYLRKMHSVKPDELVGIKLVRNEWLLISILGVLKSGAAYLPLDPANPDDRTTYILNDSDAKLLIDEQELNRFKTSANNYSAADLPQLHGASSLAYVIYTSGSTGQPKGVMITHQNVTNFFTGMNGVLGTEKGTLLSVTNYTFDISVLELMWTLTLGFKVILQGEVRNTVGTEKENKPMDFSLFYFGNADAGDEKNKYRLLLEGAKYADDNGYSAVWTPERHFHQFGGLYPSPAVLGAALAATTSRIGIRAGSVVVPLNHPLRIAEEWSVIDNLSGGRAGIACASGWHANDFVLAPGNYKNRHEVMYRNIDTLKKLWSGEIVNFEDGNGIMKETQIFPKPVQKEIPVWITSAGNVETFISAGKMGLNVLTHLLGETVEGLVVKVEAYRKAYREAGHDEKKAKVVLMLHTYIGENLEETYEKARVPFINYLKSSLGLVRNLAAGLGLDMDSARFSAQDMEDLLEYSFKRYISSASLVGTKEVCMQMLERLSRIGVNEIACLIDFGVDHDSTMKSLELLTSLKDEYNASAGDPETENYSLHHQLKKHSVTHLQSTPSMAALLNAELKEQRSMGTLKKLMLGGEQLPLSLTRSLYAQLPAVEIINMYGPTETTVWSACHKIQRDADLISIGKPIANTQIYILSNELQLLPVGVEGEIHIGGKGVARNYRNRPELSAERFIPDPFSKGNRLYKTGDYGKWLPDGTIEYIGRKDEQVKIRGYRIELGEIEAALRSDKEIEAAVVTTKKDPNGEPELVAYIVAEKTLNATDLRSMLAQRLPAYMLPAHFVQLPELPLNSNGKTDRKALPDPHGIGMDTGVEYVAPRNEVEKQLAEIWSEVLGAEKEKIGIRDNFFVLGGDSIKSIQVVSRLKQRGYSLKMQELLLHPYIEEISPKVMQQQHTGSQEIVEGAVLPGPAQSYFFERDFPAPHHYNHSVLLTSKKPVSQEALMATLDKIMLHHDALRMVFLQTENGWSQENKGAAHGYSFEVIRDIKEKDFVNYCERIQSSINLSTGPLFKVALFPGPENDRILFVAHHLVIDGISWRILFEDLFTLYRQHLSGKPLELPLKTDSFRDWQLALRKYAASSKIEKLSAYWSTLDSQEVEPLKTDHPWGSNLQKDKAEQSFMLDERTTHRLLTECYNTYRTEINDLLVASLSMALNEVLGAGKILMNMEGHGREDLGNIDISRTIGWFTSIYPVLIETRSKDPVEQLIAVKENLHRVPQKGLGYGILRYINKNNYSSTPEIIFNYLGDFGNGTGTKEEELFEFSQEAHGSIYPENMPREYKLVVLGMMVDGRIRISVEYSRKQYEVQTIEKLVNVYHEKLNHLIEKVAAAVGVRLTPVDLTYKELAVEQLDTLNNTGNIEDVYPLSPLQEGLYYHWLAFPFTATYFQQSSFQLKGKLDLVMLEKSYRTLMQRHAILRTHFNRNLGELSLQVVKKEADPVFRYLDVKNNRHFSVPDYKKADREEGFDLHSGSQIRLSIVELDTDVYELLWSNHHILMDGWCVSVLIAEFFKIYKSLVNGKNIQLKNVTPYSSYIQWLGERDEQLCYDYWKNYLADYNTISAFPKKLPVEDPGYMLEEIPFLIEGSMRQSLKVLCGELGVTENTFIQTLWGILLYKYNNTQDVVFGSVVSGRNAEIEGIEEMIGLFINTVPVRIRADEHTAVTDLLKATQLHFIESSNHHYAQLAKIQSQTALGRNLFDHILVFENYLAQELSDTDPDFDNENKELSVTASDVFDQTGYDLTLTVRPGNAIHFKLNFNRNVYDAAFISQLKNHFIQLTERVLASPAQTVKEMDILSGAEKELQLNGFNDTKAEFPSDKTLLELFEAQVEKDPDKTALVFKEKTFSYAELNAHANRLGAYLREKYTIHADDLICIKLERSEWMIISILGVLKSGAAYVPVDPEYPADRIGYIMDDSKCKALIDDAELDAFINSADNYPEKNLIHISKPYNLAYVIYTSGSTGKPKGCMLEHRGVVNRIDWMWHALGFQPDETVLQKTTNTFDVSVWELFLPLCWGNKMVLCTRENIYSPAQLISLIKTHKVNCLHFVPSMFKAFLEELNGREDAAADLQSLSRVITSGEALPAESVQSWYAKMNVPVHNLYGPTEASVDVTYYTTQPEDIQVPIGRPIWNTYMYILGKEQELLPLGASGEICIGGIGLARGYLNRAELTKEKFILNPYRPGEYLYRTGDLGQWLPDGNILYQGRFDDQVKIRGFRIELGEIENALESHPLITAAALLVKENSNREKSLAAFYVSKSSMETGVLRDYLKEMLPEYMIPSSFVHIETMPLSGSGKADKKTLSLIDIESGEEKEIVTAANDAEEKMQEIWSRVLERKVQGVTTGFFEAGGDSIKALRLLSAVNKQFKSNLDIADLYSALSIRNLCKLLNAGNSVEKDKSDIYNQFERLREEVLAFAGDRAGEIEDIYPMSDIEKGMIFESLLLEGKGVYHDQFVFETNFEDYKKELVQEALKLMVQQHSKLRSVFNIFDYSEPVNIVYKTIDTIAGYENIENLKREEQKKYVADYLASEKEKPFEIDKGPLWRFTVFSIAANKQVIIWQFHHAIIDGWSSASFITGLNNFYYTLKENKNPGVNTLPVTFKDAVAEEKYYNRLEKNKIFWQQEMADYKRLDIFSEKETAVRYTKELGSGYYDKIASAAQQHGTSIQAICFSAYVSLIGSLTYENDITVGLVGNTRPVTEGGDRILGCFLNTVPVRLQKGTDTWKGLVQHVHQKMIQLKGYPMTLLEINNVVLGPGNDGNPFFDTYFNYNDFHILSEMEGGIVQQSDEFDFADYERTNTFLDVDIIGTSGNFSVVISQLRELSSGRNAEQLAETYTRLLDQIISDPGAAIGDSYLSETEKHLLLSVFNDTDRALPQIKTFTGLLDEQVLKTPDAIALVNGFAEISYLQLDQLSSRLAHYLKNECGIRRGDAVVVNMDRSEWLVITIVALFRCGAVYVPVDPAYPKDRIDFICSDCGSRLVIDEQLLHTFRNAEIVYPENKIDVAVDPSDLAYVIYTSGTTGKPKGVMIEHIGMLNHLFAKVNDLNLLETTKKPVVAQNASHCFDISIWQMFTALLIGGKTVIYTNDIVKDPLGLTERVAEDGITILEVVPSYLGVLLELFERGDAPVGKWKQISYLLVTGEIVKRTLLNRWLEQFPDIPVVNAYGPTEASDDITHHFIFEKTGDDLSVPIGKPVQNMKIYILDQQKNLCPQGVKGMIHVAGIGVGRGYINNPAKTNEVFFDSPFSDKKERMYNTGDLGRFLANGEIEFYGRDDHQVKIRGYRIELGEIENALTGHTHIENAVVDVKSGSAGEKELVAYLTTRSGLDVQELKKFLENKLPEYMVPASFLELEFMPLTENGKIDRKKILASAEAKVLTMAEYSAPRNETESGLSLIWAELLNISPASIGIDDNFFDLGGNSISILRMRQMINKKLERNLSFATLFRFSTIRKLSGHLDNANEEVANIKFEEAASQSVGLLEDTINFLRDDEGQ